MRVVEAEHHGWLGELRGLQLSARAIALKLDDVDRILGLTAEPNATSNSHPPD